MNSASRGKVYLIGAGPGDPELITVRGKSLLESCDVVIFDNLVSFELIIALPEQIEKIYVGKKAGKHTLPQEAINKLLVDIARAGKNIARLKGGDPFVFGRGGEEAKHLKENGIDFEVIPGITAGLAGTAYAGIPCSDRSKSSIIIFVTGHKAKNKEKTSVSWEWLAKVKNGTIVIYMGVAEFSRITEILIKNGMSPNIPAAVVERASFPTQRVFTAPLAELVKISEREKIKPPALFILGEVVDLREYLNWFAGKPLLGKRIMVLRPADQANVMYRQLRELGAEVLPYQTIATKPILDENAWQQVDRHISRQVDNGWLVFTSENSVRYFIAQFNARYGDMRKLGFYKIAAIGFGTDRALKSYSLTADFIPSKFTTETLANEMVEKLRLENADIIRVRGNLGDQLIEDKLSNSGSNVVSLPVYQTFYPAWPDGFKEKLFEYPPDIIIFTSGSTVDGLHKLLDKKEVDELTRTVELVSIGPMTTRVIESYHLKVKLEAEEHSIPGIIDKLIKHYGDK